MVISVVSAKGGTGKSTIVLNLGGALSSESNKVLLVDADPQGSIAEWAKISNQDEPKVLVETDPLAEKKLKKLSKKYDYILFDSPPTFKKSMRMVMRAADWLIIPVTPGMTDFWSTQQMIDIYIEEKKRRPSVDARLLISRVDRRTRVGREFRHFLEQLNIPIFVTEIPQRVVFNESWKEGLTVNKLQPNGNGAREFHYLAKEVDLWLSRSWLKKTVQKAKGKGKK